MDELMLEFRKAVKEMVKESLIRECFHPNKAECVMPIKQAHSLQRNGRLSLIEENIKGQNQIYTVSSFSSSRKMAIKNFIPVGKKEASTFYGFCGKHDTDVFSPIENFQFDGEDLKHLFLHSYRSFAHSYHKKKQELQFYKSGVDILNKMSSEGRDQLIAGAELAMSDIEPEKQYLDHLLLNHEYDGLLYSLMETDEFYPFGCSSLVTPHFTVKNTPLEDNMSNIYERWVSLMLTVVPDKLNSFIVLAGNPNNKPAVTFIEDLEGLEDEKYLHAISSLMTIYAENTFWSPKLWDSLTESSKLVLRNNARYLVGKNEIKEFQWSSLNLFQDKFSASRLKIVK